MIRRIEIPGRPAPKQGGQTGKGGRRYQPSRVRIYAEWVAIRGRLAMAGQAPMSGPIRRNMRWVVAMPTSWSAAKRAKHHWATSGADATNVLKLIDDALQGIVYVSDRQIVEWVGSKHYDALATEDLVVIEIEALDDPEHAWRARLGACHPV